MTITVIGATPAYVAAISSAARGIEVRADAAPARASWIIVATAEQRRQAMASCGLPAFRVVHVPGLDRDGAVDASVLAEGLARMRELGPYAVEPSAAAVTITRWLMPWIRPRLERLLEGAESVESKLSEKAAINAEKAAVKAEKAERRAERARAGLVKPDTPERARQRVEQKAQRKAERRAKEPLVSETPTMRRSR